MKKAKRIKLIAVATMALILVAALVAPTALSAATTGFVTPNLGDIEKKQEIETAPIDPNIKESSFAVGEEIYTPTYTGDNSVPDGWVSIPEKLVPWLNGGAAGGWAEYDGENSTNNKEINKDKFARTSNGLKISIGGGDYALLLPTLKDKNGEEVDNYVYTVKASFGSLATKGSFGLVTGTRGSEVDFKGATAHTFYGPAHGDSWRYYHFGVGGRVDDSGAISGTAPNALPNPGGQEFTLSVYHCDGVNYFFVDGKFVNSYADKNYYNGETLSGVGLYFCGTTVVFKEISVKKATYNVSQALEVSDTSVRYCDSEGFATGKKADGLRFTATVDKTSAIYKSLVNGNFDTKNENVKLGMLLIDEEKLGKDGIIDINTPNVIDAVATKIDSQDNEKITYTMALVGIPEEKQDTSFVARAYIKVKSGNTWSYIYSRNIMTRNYASVANVEYESNSDEKVRARLDEIFASCDSYKGANTATLKFALFADFHYLEGAYISSIDDLEAIFDRANENNVDFVLQAGDFCNDFPKSPELKEAYLNNKHNLPVYGILGNHDLENGGTMATVTPILTNKANDVVWGTADGKIGDGSIAYYYYEVNGFRIICCDSDYYYQTEEKVWKHYPSWYSGPGKDDQGKSSNTNSLGPTQLAWLENVIMDAAEKEMPCIVVTHASLAGNRGSSQCSDHEAVRNIFKKANDKKVGTVLMAINGHHHTNLQEMIDGVLYLDMNTTRNGAWYANGTPHYTNETFSFVEHDTDGNVVATTEKKVSELTNSQKTWYFTDPTSAIVTVSSNGKIVVEGGNTSWLGGIDPGRGAAGEEPVVSSGIYYAAQH